MRSAFLYLTMRQNAHITSQALSHTLVMLTLTFWKLE